MRTKWESSKKVLEKWAERKKSYALELVNRGYSVKWSATAEPWMVVYLYDIDDKRTVIEMCMKCFLEKSIFGIDEGRISKLGTRIYEDYPNKQNIMPVAPSYCRGWGERPYKIKGKLVRKMYKDVLEIMN